MNFIKHIFTIVFLTVPFFMNSQNTYNQKKEYAYNGAVKKVTTYTINVSAYRIPTDTLDYYGKSILNFTKKGDVTTYSRLYNLPSYTLSSNAIYSGVGKNISYKESRSVNNGELVQETYKFIWKDDFNYEIKPLSKKDSSSRYVSLNPDYTIDKVLFKTLNFESEEKASYHYDNENILQKIVYKVTSTDNGTTTVREDVRVIKSVDVFSNPTVIYFMEYEHSRFPKSVVFKYYEYY